MDHGKVCVTGTSGFLASWLIKRLLLAGYHVIGTVRDPGVRERLHLVKDELTEGGSFDNAIMGCEGVFHTASPVIRGPPFDPRGEILKPAIDGTLNMLRSCKKNPSLRRVAFTSSSSTLRVRDDFDPNKVTIDESSWSSVEFCERLNIWYVLSKTMAEKAAWEFCNQNGINLVTILPSFVVGPSLLPTLCSTASDILGLLQGISTVIDNDELVSILSERYPTLPIPKRFEQHDRPYYKFDTTKLKSLGFKFKPIFWFEAKLKPGATSTTKV
ncbi:hypothetical protein L6452_05228 [Arctium lappa]|uniref:Uncharacterized protein n=1 Tax=Arctium lappa TaxID=4217 RepID=A0ACB9EGA3_ARCLA|nr:hypothetical protein L6452_05228 [Arctium lappa]